MMNTVWAVVQDGKAVPIEKIKLPENARVLLTLWPDEEPEVKGTKPLRPYGLARGDFTVPDDFDAPLPEDELELWMAVSDSALKAVWDNEEDDGYAELYEK